MFISLHWERTGEEKTKAPVNLGGWLEGFCKKLLLKCKSQEDKTAGFDDRKK
jgi:hypothetical protein